MRGSHITRWIDSLISRFVFLYFLSERVRCKTLVRSNIVIFFHANCEINESKVNRVIMNYHSKKNLRDICIQKPTFVLFLFILSVSRFMILRNDTNQTGRAWLITMLRGALWQFNRIVDKLPRCCWRNSTRTSVITVEILNNRLEN